MLVLLAVTLVAVALSVVDIAVMYNEETDGNVSFGVAVLVGTRFEISRIASLDLCIINFPKLVTACKKILPRSLQMQIGCYTYTSALS